MEIRDLDQPADVEINLVNVNVWLQVLDGVEWSSAILK